MLRRSITSLLVAAMLFSLVPGLGLAQEQNEDMIRLQLDQATVERGYTLHTPSDELIMGIFPGVVHRPARVTMRKGLAEDAMEAPEGMHRVSEIYEFDILTDPIQIFGRDVILALKYHSDTNHKRRAFFWDGNRTRWIPLSSYDVPDQQRVRAFTHLPYSKIAIFEEGGVQEGIASWYRDSQHPLTASSNDYALGTKVRVTNIDNGTSVDVTIRSRGPYVDGRIIDLTYDAFDVIANPGIGVIHVRVEAVDSIAEEQGQEPSSSAPAISASSAIVFDPVNNRVIYEKDQRQQSIASITKLMTVMVYLEWHRDHSGVPFDQLNLTYSASDNVGSGESSIDMSSGDVIAADEAMKAVLIASANNVTKTLARSTGMSTSEFAARMNDAARRLGMSNTHFVEPTGIDAGNVSTPADVVKLVNYILNRNGVRLMTVSASDAISANTGTNHERIITLHSTNHILGSGLPIFGGKTGYLGTGHASFALKFVDGAKQRVVVILGSENGNTRNDDMLRLGRWAMEQ
ncbi:MAG: serine hydrolase [Candidatus Nomurabacteria bacterium]|nr:MAG: serine hydrolase [Candidatus Nomurabacteria bacterium]